MKQGNSGYFDNWDCEIRYSEIFCMSIGYLVNLTRRFNLAQVWDPNIAGIVFWPMSDNKGLNSASLTLVICFDPKHFLVEKSVRESIISLRPNRQYEHALIWNQISSAYTGALSWLDTSKSFVEITLVHEEFFSFPYLSFLSYPQVHLNKHFIVFAQVGVQEICSDITFL